MSVERINNLFVALALVAALVLGGYAAKYLITGDTATTHSRGGRAIAVSTAKPVFAVYYLWWTTQHWHDLLGPSYPYTASPNPLPAKLGAGDVATSLYVGNKLTDVSQHLGYDQNKASVIETDVRAAAARGVSGFSVNWKGTGAATQSAASNGFNQRLQYVFDAVHKVNAEGIPFKVQLNYQASATHLSQTYILNDLNYYYNTYGKDSAQDHHFSVRPTMLWVGSWKYSDTDVSAISHALRSRFYMLGDEKGTTWNANAAANFDGDTYYWSSQDPYRNPQSFSQISALAAKVRSTKNPNGSAKVWLAPFTPGFNASLRYGGGTPVPRNGGTTMHKLYDGNKASNPDGWTFISWNEIAEGSYIVPLTRWGNTYLNTLGSIIGGAVTPPPPPPPPPTTTTPPPPPPPPTTTTPPPPPPPPTSGTVDKVLLFVEENHSLTQMQSGMPYVYSQAKQYGYATDYTAMIHPSLGNYLAIAFGNSFGVTDDAAPPTHNQTAMDVFTAAINAGRTARSYQESMGTNCSPNSSNGYAVKHNPWAYASSPASHAACLANDVPSGTITSGRLHDDIVAGTLPNVGEVTPNICNDAHDCSLGVADNWMKGWLTLIYASPDWKSGHLAIIITADEDNGSQGNKVLTVVIHGSQSGRVVTSPLNHYSMTGLLNKVGHASCLANGCSAASFATAFGLTIAP